MLVILLLLLGLNLLTILNKNNGSVTAENIVVTDCLNENLSFISASEGYVIDGNNIKWDIAGMEAGGEKALK